MKTYQQVGEVLAFVQSTHRRMRDVCNRLSQDTDSQKSQVLMDVFGDHEDELQRVLGAAGGEQRRDILATWVQYVPAQPIEDILDDLEGREGLTWDRAAQAILRLQEAMAELWTQVAAQIETPVVQDVVSSLADAERQMSRRLSKQLLAFQEM